VRISTSSLDNPIHFLYKNQKKYAYTEEQKYKIMRKVFYFTFLTGDVGAPWPPATEGAVTATDADCVLVVFALLLTPAKVLVLSAKYLEDFNFHFSFTISSLPQHEVEFPLDKFNSQLSQQHFIIYTLLFPPSHPICILVRSIFFP